MEEKPRYLNKIIPHLIKKTRDGHMGDINSRLMRSRAYANRLLFKYSTHSKYGADNHKKPSDDE
jgi:hypothetical protein